MESNYPYSQNANQPHSQQARDEHRPTHFQNGLSGQQAGFGLGPTPDTETYGYPVSQYHGSHTQQTRFQGSQEPQHTDFALHQPLYNPVTGIINDPFLSDTDFQYQETDYRTQYTGIGANPSWPHVGFQNQQTGSYTQYTGVGNNPPWPHVGLQAAQPAFASPHQEADFGHGFQFEPSTVALQYNQQQQADRNFQPYHPGAVASGHHQQAAGFGVPQQIQPSWDGTQAPQWQPGYTQQRVTVPAVDLQDLHLSQLRVLLEMHGAPLMFDYRDLNLDQLRKMMGKRGIRFRKDRCSKADLIQALQNYDRFKGTG
ncbi:hypothetical protein HO133_003835 [Letharia lupina]|uniref:Uncharacterized protein n=1 Tax=Letharia lupina TaxID=560253 RepID=A0A8H6F9D1_9LECA|nr:uncharacterized protein HO133_003835 [Letharia lupina]KAF6220010.1 hypothetical protein HO133_003835 [Letharia lupina]